MLIDSAGLVVKQQEQPQCKNMQTCGCNAQKRAVSRRGSVGGHEGEQLGGALSGRGHV